MDTDENTGCELDADCDDDTFNDGIDAFPLNPAEWLDTDGDAPAGSDGTGYGDNSDAFPTDCLLYTSPSPRDVEESRMPSSA